MRLWLLLINVFITFDLWAEVAQPIDFSNKLSASPYRVVEDGRFYWEEFLEAGQEPQGPGVPAAAAVWNGWSLPDGRKLEPFGYATYEFRIKGLKPDEVGYQFGLRTASTSFRLIAYPLEHPDEAVSVQSGQVGRSLETTLPSQRYAFVAMKSRSVDEVWVIRIQVANFLHKRGGMWQKPFIGHGDSIQRMFRGNEQKDIFSLGFMLLMVFHGLMLYVRRKEDMESLMLAATSAMAFFRTLATGTLYYSTLEHDSLLAFLIQFRFEYVTLAGGPICYMLFVHFSFREQSNDRLVLGMTLIALFNIALAIFAPIQVFTGFLGTYQIGFMSVLVYFYLVLYRAWRAGHNGAGTALLGALAVSLTGTYDIFVNMNIVPQPYVAQYGVSVFLLFQSQVIAGRFAHAFRTAERLQKELRLEVERQTNDIRSLMENVPQGIFMLQSDLCIQGNYSLYLERLLGFEDLEGKPGLEVLFAGVPRSNEVKSMTMSALIAAMDEESLVWSFNESCLPRELRRRHPNGEMHILEIDWHPIISARDHIERVLVSLRNVTRVRELEAESRRQKVDFEILIEIIQAGRSDVLRFLEQGHLYVKRCQDLIQDEAQTLDAAANKIFLHIHTLKGLARALGLRTMTTQIHDLEQDLGLHQRDHWQGWTREQATAVVDSCGSVFVAYQRILEEKLHWQGDHGGELLSEGDLKDLDREMRRLPALPQLPAPVQPLVRKVERIVTRLAYHEVFGLQGDLSREARSLALELGKPIPQVKFEGAGILLSRTAESLLRAALVHLVRNSLDHGLESTEERRRLRKNNEGLIQLTFEDRGDRLLMRYADDGRGLNLEAIRERAINQGLMTADRRLTPEQLADFVFESGFSTKAQVDMISGRGVGMDAVRHLFAEAGGRIWIELPKQGPAAFVILGELPATLYRTTELLQEGA